MCIPSKLHLYTDIYTHTRQEAVYRLNSPKRGLATVAPSRWLQLGTLSRSHPHGSQGFIWKFPKISFLMYRPQTVCLERRRCKASDGSFRSHLQVGGLEVGSFHTPPIRILKRPSFLMGVVYHIYERLPTCNLRTCKKR